MTTDEKSPGFFARFWRFWRPLPPLPRAENPLRIGVLGAARITPAAVIYPARLIPDVHVVSVAARDEAKAKEFAKKHDIPTTHKTYDELIQDPSIDAIYNPLPNGLHYEWSLKAIQAGKHVLLEKPFTSNAHEAELLVKAANEKGVVLLEAFHYRFHPGLVRVQELVQSGELGEIRHVECRTTAPPIFSEDDIRFNIQLAGGACMDIGSYTLNAIRLAASGQVPKRVISAKAELIKPDVDHTMRVRLEFEGGLEADGLATLRGSWFRLLSNLRIVGTEKELEFKNIFLPSIWHSLTVKDLATGSKRTEKHYGDGGSTYTYMLRRFEALCRGRTNDPIVTLQDSVNNMRTLDMVYRAAGLSVRGTKVPITEETTSSA